MIKGYIHSDVGFYVGDICYVMNDDVYDNVWGKKYEYKDGIWNVEKCGEYEDVDFAVGGTAYGDGEYHDTKDRYTFPVDAGVIGVVPYELFKDYFKSMENEQQLYNYGTYISGCGDILFEVNDNGKFVITLPNNELIVIKTNDNMFDLE